MIAKLSKGGSFSGAVQYIFGPGKGANCLAGMGVLFKDTPSIIRGFERQAAQNPGVSKPVGHVVLSFSPRDAARLDNRLLLSIAVEYLDRMGIKDTQLIIVRHRDREHPHLHILFNRVGNDGRTISDHNDRYRSERLCKQLTARYGLYFASGKEQVKEYRLREPDKTKYEIYHALCDAVPRCRNWEELTAALRREGNRHGVPDARRHLRRAGCRVCKKRLPVQRLEDRPAVQLFENRHRTGTELPTGACSRTPIGSDPDTFVQLPAGRFAASEIRSRRSGRNPAGTTAQTPRATALRATL